MIAVLDASAATELLIKGPNATLIGDAVVRAEWVLVPGLYVAELTNVFWKYHQFAKLPYTECEQAIATGLELPDTFSDDRDLHREAFAMACRCTHSVYDMLYLVLARRHAAQLITMDKKLKQLANKHDVTTL
jgi:predicted nucleic acid-binding protein